MLRKIIVFAAIISLAACKGKNEDTGSTAEAFERARIRLQQDFHNVDTFSTEGLARASANDSATYIDSTGKLLIPYKYNVQSFSEGFGLVEESEDGPLYFIDKTGKKVLDLPNYKNAFAFDGDYAIVRNKEGDGLYGMIDKTGKEIIPCIYEEGPQQLNGDNYVVSLPTEDGKKVINIKGQSAPALKGFTDLYYDAVNNQYAMHNKDGWFLVAVDGTTKKKIDADGVFYPRNGVFIVHKEVAGQGTQTGLMDGNGNMAVPYGKYYDIEQMSDGLACVGIETGTSPGTDPGVTNVHVKVGYVDKTGKEVIPPQFEDMMQSFNDGLAIAMKGGKVGYIDKTGNWVIQPQFDKAQPFSNGYAKVTSSDNVFYIDKKGNKAL